MYINWGEWLCKWLGNAQYMVCSLWQQMVEFSPKVLEKQVISSMQIDGLS